MLLNERCYTLLNFTSLNKTRKYKEDSFKFLDSEIHIDLLHVLSLKVSSSKRSIKLYKAQKNLARNSQSSHILINDLS